MSLQETTNKPIQFGVGKYKNIMGVTCYMNSILHILQQTPIFIQYISQVKFRDVLMQKVKDAEDPEATLKEYIIIELFRLFKVSLENDDVSITPTSFREAIGKKNDMWTENQQQDSQEFFNFLVSHLEEEVGTKCRFIPGNELEHSSELNSQHSFSNIAAMNSWIKFQAKEYSPLKNLFNGMTENTRRCSCCGNISNVFEPFVTLGLSIPIKSKLDMMRSFNIYECIDNLVNEEQLDTKNKLNCDMCGIKNRGFSKVQLWQTPKILVLHLKRFLTNSCGIPTQKLNNMIEYPITNLDLSKYFDSASPHKNNSKYDLFAINMHHAFGGGRSINYGHYTTLVKNMINNHWHHYNDSNTIEIATELKHIQSDKAYMLFYYRHD